MNKNDLILAKEGRIKILEARPKANANIVNKLKRQLRALKA